MKRVLVLLAVAAVMSMGATTTVQCDGIPSITIDGGGLWIDGSIPVVVVDHHHHHDDD